MKKSCDGKKFGDEKKLVMWKKLWQKKVDDEKKLAMKKSCDRKKLMMKKSWRWKKVATEKSWWWKKVGDEKKLWRKKVWRRKKVGDEKKLWQKKVWRRKKVCGSEIFWRHPESLARSSTKFEIGLETKSVQVGEILSESPESRKFAKSVKLAKSGRIWDPGRAESGPPLLSKAPNFYQRDTFKIVTGDLHQEKNFGRPSPRFLKSPHSWSDLEGSTLKTHGESQTYVFWPWKSPKLAFFQLFGHFFGPNKCV